MGYMDKMNGHNEPPSLCQDDAPDVEFGATIALRLQIRLQFKYNQIKHTPKTSSVSTHLEIFRKYLAIPQLWKLVLQRI